MQTKPYMIGRWGVFKDLESQEVLGHIVDGAGQSTLPGRPPFDVSNGALFDPDGRRLGHLAPLGDVWAVNHGDNDTGHVLRPA